VSGACRRRVALALVVAASALGPAGLAPAALAEQREVAVLQATFVDRSRPTAAHAGMPRASNRTLVTTIWYPRAVDRPLPLVVFAHGSNDDPRRHTGLLRAWARAGYVVAAPAFPLTNRGLPGRPLDRDVAHQPEDLSFVISEMFALGGSPSGPLAGLIDSERLGVAGYSLGGQTVYGAAFHACCRDQRIDVVIAMSARKGSFEGGSYRWEGTPLLLLHGSADRIYSTSRRIYRHAQSPKYLVTIRGATHASPFDDEPDPAARIVRRVTVGFYDRYLKGDDTALARLLIAARLRGIATLEHQP
jgi:predicted dienelactone hydrolase